MKYLWILCVVCLCGCGSRDKVKDSGDKEPNYIVTTIKEAYPVEQGTYAIALDDGRKTVVYASSEPIVGEPVRMQIQNGLLLTERVAEDGETIRNSVQEAGR